MKKSALLVFLVTAAAALPTHAASVFTFTNGCKITCSGDWSHGTTPGSVACNGKVTDKSASCPAIAGPAIGAGALAAFKVDGAVAAEPVRAEGVRNLNGPKTSIGK